MNTFEYSMFDFVENSCFSIDRGGIGQSGLKNGPRFFVWKFFL